MHSDVLSEEPTDEPGKLRLVEEVKNRAKGAFQKKDMNSAHLLYSKAITLLESLPGKEEAVLYSNRSMVRLNLNKVEEALEDSKKCLNIDPNSVKAYHRKAQALVRLNEWDDAISAAEAGMALDPTNKAFSEIIEKATQEKEKDKEDKAKLKRDAQDVRVELHNASTSRQNNPPAKKQNKDGDEADIGMRGYKTTTDGKTTSFFHTEITQEAKELIAKAGFGKPQKLDAPTEDKEAKGGGSSWNQAGTYEERSMVKWVKTELPQALKTTSFDLPQGGSATVTGVVDIEGDASVTVARGKRKHLLDLSFTIEYDINVGNDTGKGKLLFSEVTANDDEDMEIKSEVSSETAGSLKPVIDAFVKSSGTGLQPLVIEAINKFIAEFKQM